MGWCISFIAEMVCLVRRNASLSAATVIDHGVASRGIPAHDDLPTDGGDRAGFFHDNAIAKHPPWR